MKKDFLLDFEFICKKHKDLIGLELGKKSRKYFEDMGINFKKLEEVKNIVLLIPKNALTIDKDFISGFIGDRIEENGLNMFIKYSVSSNALIIYKIIKDIIIKNAEVVERYTQLT